MTRKVALITGVTGQDGAYLAEVLLDFQGPDDLNVWLAKGY